MKTLSLKMKKLQDEFAKLKAKRHRLNKERDRRQWCAKEKR